MCICLLDRFAFSGVSDLESGDDQPCFDAAHLLRSVSSGADVFCSAVGIAEPVLSEDIGTVLYSERLPQL